MLEDLVLARQESKTKDGAGSYCQLVDFVFRFDYVVPDLSILDNGHWLATWRQGLPAD